VAGDPADIGSAKEDIAGLVLKDIDKRSHLIRNAHIM
jgi:hypothetical protein